MKILIADDHEIVRKGVVSLLKAEFSTADIYETANGAEAVKESLSIKFDLIILDISMPEKNGLQALKEIRSNGIMAPVLMLSMQPEDQYTGRAIKAGASGFVNKENARAELVPAIKIVLDGRKYFPQLTGKANAGLQNKDKSNIKILSERELQVLSLIGSGKTATEIADHLQLSITTVSTYRARVMEKLSLSNNAELMRFAIDNGIV